jgi:ribonuclease D
MDTPLSGDQFLLPTPILVSNTVELQDCIAQLTDCDAIAIDTEFMRTDTFFPILGLVQIFNGKDCWLIDPVPIPNLSPLADLLTNKEIVKVFHSCSEDIEVLKHVLNCIPRPLFDTQIAAAFAGYGFSKGYAAIVEAILGIHVEKSETRSNWLQRPLSENQLGYAALDVIHLLPVYRHLCEVLVQLDRKLWVDEDMRSLVKNATDKEDLSLYFQKVKGAWQFSPQDLSALQVLCEWREAEARNRNRPRGRIIDDKTLLDIVLKKPESKLDLSSMEGMHPGLIRRYAEKLLDLLSDGLAKPEREYPGILPEPLPRNSREMVKKLKQVVSTQAELLNLAPEVLARKRDIEFLVQSIMKKEACLPKNIAFGWRAGVIGKSLLDAANAAV